MGRNKCEHCTDVIIVSLGIVRRFWSSSVFDVWDSVLVRKDQLSYPRGLSLRLLELCQRSPLTQRYLSPLSRTRDTIPGLRLA
jgi:hypothetical protein